MNLNLSEILAQWQGNSAQLFQQHINPQFAKVLKTIGFDRQYVRAQGSYLYDQHDQRIIDFLAGYGVFNIGRNHPVARDFLQQFLKNDLASLVQMEMPLLASVLAQELKTLVPDELSKVYFTNSGAEAVEAAIKFARCATGKPGILYCQQAFHGLTNGALSLNGAAWFREGFEPLLPHCNAIALNDVESLRMALAQQDVAALIVEPIQGKGVFVAEDDYFIQAKKLCEEAGALLIVDEVQTGLGRTGKMFAFEYSGITPDILLLSKALSAGYVPVGAVLMREAIYASVFSAMERSVVHSSTFGQGAFAMAAGLASLHVLKQEKLPENAATVGDYLLTQLREIQQGFDVVHAIRGRGLMIGIEFARPKSLKAKLAWNMANKLYQGLFTQAIVISLFKDFGILTQVAGRGVDIIKLIPPLVLNLKDAEYFIASFTQVLQRSQRFPGPIWDLAMQLAKGIMKK